MRARSNARRSAVARLVADRSTPSAECSAGPAGPLARVSAGGSSSGRTADSDSANLGSNPSPPAKFKKPRTQMRGFFPRRSDELHATGTTDDQQIGRARSEHPDGHHTGDLIEPRLQRHRIGDRHPVHVEYLVAVISGGALAPHRAAADALEAPGDIAARHRDHLDRQWKAAES